MRLNFITVYYLTQVSGEVFSHSFSQFVMQTFSLYFCISLPVTIICKAYKSNNLTSR